MASGKFVVGKFVVRKFVVGKFVVFAVGGRQNGVSARLMTATAGSAWA